MATSIVLFGGDMSDDSTPASIAPADHRIWFLRGARASISVPALILVSAFIGFAGLAREAGITLAQAVFMTGVVWALPGKVVLIGAIMAGSSLPAAAFAVALSSARLMPMVVALVPEMRAAQTRRLTLYALSHFVAVTSWVLAMEKLGGVPRHARTAYYAGLGGTLVVGNMVVVVIVYMVAPSLPPSVSAALLFLTPMYFLTSLWSSGRESASHFAMVFGMILGPVFHVIAPGFDLLIAGTLGGLAAFLIHCWRRKRI